MTALALLALSIQMLAVQSHVHHFAAADDAVSGTALTHVSNHGNDPGAGGQHRKYPENQDPAKCPFCQQLGHSGQFIGSSVVLIAIRCGVAFFSVAFSDSARFLDAVRHNWQSRAPPQE